MDIYPDRWREEPSEGASGIELAHALDHALDAAALDAAMLGGAMTLEAAMGDAATLLSMDEPIPSVRIRNGARTMTISVELPGVEEGGILIRLVGRELVISGERRAGGGDAQAPQMPRHMTSFYHTIALPVGVLADHERISAVYHDGMLKISVPKPTA